IFSRRSTEYGFIVILDALIFSVPHLPQICCKYFAAKENQDLGVVKALRKPVSKLDLSPFPAPS
ncbi:MAG: hypothetical protein V7K63_22730, partial [Nostoc sp.]